MLKPPACQENPPHIVAAQEGWRPVLKEHADPRMYRVDYSKMYWTKCARIVADASFGDRVYEDVYIPDSDPDFEPILSPMRMMNIGIFGNAYFGSLREDTNYPIGRHRWSLFPGHALLDGYVGYDKANWKTAYFQKKASSTREWWLERNLISRADPLGQFEWYCWYWMGRRIPDEDAHQIARWKNFQKRQSAMLETKPTATGLKQALLHWSCDPWICD